MKLIIFSCSPRPEKASNTAAIVDAFKSGFLSVKKEDVDIYYLYKRSEWDKYRTLFKENTEIIFALPLFVECIPGLLMEFLETLEPKDNTGNKTKVGFILNSGFEEACQLRTCEKYLETLPSYFNCDYSGTLIKGGMFPLLIFSEATKAKMLKPFIEMGKIYAKEGIFEKSKVTKFAAPERFSVPFRLLIFLLRPLSKIIMGSISRKLGCTEKINRRPYEIY
jgi:hypothetical protein